MEHINQLNAWARQIEQAKNASAADFDVARRLLIHGIEAANEIKRLSEIAGRWNLECDAMREDNKRLAAERDELLSALEPFAALSLVAPLGAIFHEDFGMDVLRARAVIAKVKGGVARTNHPLNSAFAVPKGYVMIGEEYLRHMIGDEKMGEIRGMCNFPIERKGGS